MPADHTAFSTLDIPANPHSVRQALHTLIGHLNSLRLEDEELGSVELVVAEALNNIVEHAYRNQPEGRIQLNWQHGETGLIFRIEDAGDPMPDNRVPLRDTKDAQSHAALIPEGGFGWFLIHGLARNVVYRREQGRNVLTFRLAVGLSLPPLAPAFGKN